jgi:hypothetical protein
LTGNKTRARILGEEKKQKLDLFSDNNLVSGLFLEKELGAEGGI